MRKMKIEVGATVLYLPEFAAEFNKKPSAAIITAVRFDGTVSLTVFEVDCAPYCVLAASFSEDPQERCWSWQPFDLADIL